MTTWIPSEIEAIVGSKFTIPEQEEPFQYHEVFFAAGGIQYCLNVCPVSEHVWIRADVDKPDQATPHFEFSFRCDRIRTGDGGYDSRAIYFEFSNGEKTVELQRHCRLVIDRLPSGNFYTWPVVGASDQPLDRGQIQIKEANKPEMATPRKPSDLI